MEFINRIHQMTIFCLSFAQKIPFIDEKKNLSQLTTLVAWLTAHIIINHCLYTSQNIIFTMWFVALCRIKWSYDTRGFVCLFIFPSLAYNTLRNSIHLAIAQIDVTKFFPVLQQNLQCILCPNTWTQFNCEITHRLKN